MRPSTMASRRRVCIGSVGQPRLPRRRSRRPRRRRRCLLPASTPRVNEPADAGETNAELVAPRLLSPVPISSTSSQLDEERGEN